MAIEQIKFFYKNEADISKENVVITASQGQEYADFVRNRNNMSGWMTTGSVDADNTTFEVDFGDPVNLDHIMLLDHNFKNYTIKYWNSSSYVDFSTAISVSNNTATDKVHEFTLVNTEKILLTITGTMTANDDKRLAQLIATSLIGQPDGWPLIEDPKVGRNRVISKLLSGKSLVRENVGNFACSLAVPNWSSSADLAIVEALYDANEGFLVWLCGGDENQFSSVRKGYRMRDIYLMKCQNEHTPEWSQGFYKSGMKIKINLVEVVD